MEEIKIFCYVVCGKDINSTNHFPMVSSLVKLFTKDLVVY